MGCTTFGEIWRRFFLGEFSIAKKKNKTDQNSIGCWQKIGLIRIKIIIKYLSTSGSNRLDFSHKKRLFFGIQELWKTTKIYNLTFNAFAKKQKLFQGR